MLKAVCLIAMTLCAIVLAAMGAVFFGEIVMDAAEADWLWLMSAVFMCASCFAGSFALLFPLLEALWDRIRGVDIPMPRALYPDRGALDDVLDRS